MLYDILYGIKLKIYDFRALTKYKINFLDNPTPKLINLPLYSVK